MPAESDTVELSEHELRERSRATRLIVRAGHRKFFERDHPASTHPAERCSSAPHWENSQVAGSRMQFHVWHAFPRERVPLAGPLGESKMPPVAVAVAPYYEASHGLCRPPGGLGGELLSAMRQKRTVPAAARLDWHSSGGRGNYGRRMANRYEYTVVELREGMIGGKMSGDKLEMVLNEHAAQGLATQGDHLRRSQGPRRAGRGRRSPRHL